MSQPKLQRDATDDHWPQAQAVRVRAVPSQKTLVLTVLAVMLIVVLLGTGALLAQPDSAATTAARPMPFSTATRVPQQTPAPPTLTPAIAQIPDNPPGQGWTNDTQLSWAQNITFAPNAAATAYACGPNPGVPAHIGALSSNPARQYAVGRSVDGGHSWTLVNTTIMATSCSLFVAPSNAHDVVMLTDYGQGSKGCSPCNGGSATVSYDSGQSWQALTLPNDPTGAITGIQTVAWAGSDLLLTASANVAILPLSVHPPQIAQVIPSGTTQWIDGQIFTATQPFGFVDTAFSLGQSAYVSISYPATTSDLHPGGALLRTRDGGQTWQATKEPTLSTFWPSANGHAIYGQASETNLARSLDGGVTWQSLPQTLGLMNQSCLDATDMTLYCPVFSSTGPPTGVTFLPPGASQWRYLGALPAGDAVLAVQVNSAGQPLQLWGAQSNGPTDGIATGLQTYGTAVNG